MAIRLDTPQLPSTDLRLAAPSPQAAAAPYQALTGIARTLAETSQHFEGIANDIQKQDDFFHLSNLRNQWAEQKAYLDNDLANASDPELITSKNFELIETMQQRMLDSDLSPSLRRQAENEFNRWASNTRIAAAGQAAKLTSRRAAQSADNEVNAAFSNNDPEQLETTLSTGLSAGVFLPEEADKIRSEFNQKQAKDTWLRNIHEDPANYLINFSEAGPPPDVNPVDHQRYLSLSRTLLRHSAADAFDNFQDLVAEGRLTTPEQIDQLFGDQRPAVIAKFKQQLADLADASVKARQASPQWQQQNLGELTEIFSRYQAEPGDNIDADYIDAARRVRAINDPDVKKEFQRKLDNLRSGQLDEIKDSFDYASQRLDELFNSGEIYPFETTETLGSILDRGFLTDTNQLQRLGFSEDQIDDIQDFKKESDRIAYFRNHWTGAGMQDGYRKDVASALKRGATSSTKFTATSATRKEEARRRYGILKESMIRWRKAHPKATPEQIDQQFNFLMNQGSYQQTQKAFIPAPFPISPVENQQYPLLPSRSE